MMKTIPKSVKLRIALLGVLIIASGLVFLKQVKQTQALTVPSTPTLPSKPYSEMQIATQVPRLVMKRTDLTLGLNVEEKFTYIVQRSDGTFEEYVIPASFSGDVQSLLKLTAGDRLVTGYPLRRLQSTPVLTPPAPTLTLTQPPYPAPKNSIDAPHSFPYP